MRQAKNIRDIATVSDTALWMAAIRAQESRRADAVFADPLAEVLAGRRGSQIARSMPRRAMVSFGVVTRTCAIDRLIDDALDDGIDTVVNAGSGLDTRPYRMKLPSDLRWFELDFPDVTAHKDAVLRESSPNCRLRRIGVDLLDRAARNEVFAESCDGARRVLVIMEGVVSYFSTAEVSRLAADWSEIPAFHYWLLDYDNAGARPMPAGWDKKLDNAPFKFAPTEWFEFFKDLGWKAKTAISTAEQAESLARSYPLDFPYGLLMRVLPEATRRKILELSGAVTLERVMTR